MVIGLLFTLRISFGKYFLSLHLILSEPILVKDNLPSFSNFKLSSELACINLFISLTIKFLTFY